MLKPLARVVVLATLGTVLGLFAVIEFQEWRLRAKLRALEQAAADHELTPDNPPSPESFFPMRAVERPPVVRGFEILTAFQAAERLDATEMVLAVEVDGEARAYPLNVMTGPKREVLNDELGDRTIAATW